LHTRCGPDAPDRCLGLIQYTPQGSTATAYWRPQTLVARADTLWVSRTLAQHRPMATQQPQPLLASLVRADDRSQHARADSLLGLAAPNVHEGARLWEYAVLVTDVVYPPGAIGPRIRADSPKPSPANRRCGAVQGPGPLGLSAALHQRPHCTGHPATKTGGGGVTPRLRVNAAIAL
jgi:hypothetical protein